MSKFKFFKISKTKKIRFIVKKNPSKVCVVFLHGFMSNIEGEKPSKIAQFCSKKKINFLALEYSGHGKSYGEFTDGNISKWTSDTLRTIKSKIDNKEIIIVGSSMGSWIAINVILKLKSKIKGFIGISSAPEFLERLMWKKFNNKIKNIILKKKIYFLEKNNTEINDGNGYPITKQLIFDGRKNNVFNKKINLKIPVTLFHSKKDAVVPVSFSKKTFSIFNGAKKKFILLKDGNHRLSRKKDLTRICKEINNIIQSLKKY